MAASRSSPDNDAPFRLIRDVSFGSGVRVFSFVNLYGCSIGDESVIGPFVEIQQRRDSGEEMQGPEPFLHLLRGRDRG